MMSRGPGLHSVWPRRDCSFIFVRNLSVLQLLQQENRGLFVELTPLISL